ncbi:hypothetical protein ACFCZ6_01270 [Streptomyces hydrogenans]|uniref:hypothetical protein n=1 Tax=Streptomyces hydrogenans TaxID=1873719 RepID=UPI0035D91921
MDLLARGWSDERIAKELTVGKRTVQRRVRKLMESRECNSRFALGFTLGREALAEAGPGRTGGGKPPVAFEGDARTTGGRAGRCPAGRVSARR